SLAQFASCSIRPHFQVSRVPVFGPCMKLTMASRSPDVTLHYVVRGSSLESGNQVSSCCVLPVLTKTTPLLSTRVKPQQLCANTIRNMPTGILSGGCGADKSFFGDKRP